MFPILDKLNILKFDVVTLSNWATHALLESYAGHLKKLEIHVCQLQLPASSRKVFRLTNLTELNLLFDRDDDLPINQLTERSSERILNSIHAPNLLRLQFKCRYLVHEPTGSIVCMQKMAHVVIRRFPKLQILQELMPPFIVRESNDRVPHPLSSSWNSESLTFIEIQDSVHLTFDFLECFPKLHTLRLMSPFPPRAEDQLVTVVDHSPSPANPKISIREQIQTAQLYRSNVWELVPELKEICINVPDSDKKSCRFDRTTYIKLKGEGKTTFLPEVLEPLREDIWKSLSGLWCPSF